MSVPTLKIHWLVDCIYKNMKLYMFLGFVCIILLIRRRQLWRCIQHVQLPNEAIHPFPEQDKIRFIKLLETEKTENRYFLRIMIVGKGSVGKTCLLRRLLKESISDVTSTDGVDIVVRRCKINIKDGTWLIGKEKNDDKIDRIKRAISPNSENKDTNKMHDGTKNIDIDHREKMSSSQKDIATDKNVSKDESTNINESASLVTTNANVSKDTHDVTNDSSSLAMHKDSTSHARVNFYENKDRKKPLVMPEDLMSHVFSKSTVNKPLNLYALCEFWDFAGQKEFYATHQAFLTSCAVYLVVADMQDDISKPGLNQCFADFQHIGEYVEFWFDSIHCHRKTNERSRYEYFDPPILLVFTGKDRYNKADFEKRQKALDNQIDEALELKSKYRHLHKKFYLSNLKDTDEEFEKLRCEIYKAARKMDNWGNLFPLKWILLEHLIEINKNNNTNFISFTDMVKLAQHRDINILNEEDLLMFLRFQHTVGNIIFFENITDLIILRPQWLADAYRCLVSDRIEINSLHHREDWTGFKRQGKISESLITELFKSKDGSQFSGQKSNLHSIMEKLDILVKIKDSGYFIMPSMMPSAKFEDVCKNVGILRENCKRSSWLCFKFEFLPPSFFNHVSAWFMKQYKPSKVDSSSNAVGLYRGICMFDIDRSGCEKIMVTMSTDTIALQFVSFSEQQEGFGSTCSDIFREVEQLIKEITVRYRVTIFFKLHFKCSDGYYYKDTFEFESLKQTKECFCVEHQKAHQSKQLYSTWMTKPSQSCEIKPVSDPSIESISQAQTTSSKVCVRVKASKRDISNIHDESTAAASLTGFTKEEINFTKMGMIALNILADVLYDLLKPDKPHLRPRCGCDISYLYSEHRKLNKHVPSNSNHRQYPYGPWGGNWLDIQNTDIAIGDDIERIRLTRNELQHSNIFQINDTRFNELCHILSELLKRFGHYNKPTRLYTDQLNEILAKTVSAEEVKSIENEISGMAIEVEIEHQINVPTQ